MEEIIGARHFFPTTAVIVKKELTNCLHREPFVFLNRKIPAKIVFLGQVAPVIDYVITD